jgi:hypothetical protein
LGVVDGAGGPCSDVGEVALVVDNCLLTKMYESGWLAPRFMEQIVDLRFRLQG